MEGQNLVAGTFGSRKSKWAVDTLAEQQSKARHGGTTKKCWEDLHMLRQGWQLKLLKIMDLLGGKRVLVAYHTEGDRLHTIYRLSWRKLKVELGIK